MRTLEELRTFYDTTLMGKLAAMEEERKKRLHMAGVGLAVGIVIFVISLFIMMAVRVPFIALLGLIAAIAVGAAVARIGAGDYAWYFKAAVIEPLVRFVDPALNYTHAQCIPEGAFIQSRMFAQKPDRYKGDDLVSGKVGATQISFSEVHAEYKTTNRDSKGRTHTQWHTIFKGLLFVGDFNKNFHSTTVVSPDIAERLLGRFGQNLQGMTFLSDLKLVKLEDPQFEKLFVVYGHDQIEARYILSTSLMQRIVQFRNKTGTDINLSFTGSRMFVAIPHTKDMFEPKVFQTLLNFDMIRGYFEDICLAVGIVEDLNLNTRIWSKE